MLAIIIGFVLIIWINIRMSINMSISDIPRNKDITHK